MKRLCFIVLRQESTGGCSLEEMMYRTLGSSRQNLWRGRPQLARTIERPEAHSVHCMSHGRGGTEAEEYLVVSYAMADGQEQLSLIKTQSGECTDLLRYLGARASRYIEKDVCDPLWLCRIPFVAYMCFRNAAIAMVICQELSDRLHPPQLVLNGGAVALHSSIRWCLKDEGLARYGWEFFEIVVVISAKIDQGCCMSHSSHVPLKSGRMKAHGTLDPLPSTEITGSLAAKH